MTGDTDRRARTEIVPGRFYGADMTDSDRWWEPPLAGTEVEHLVGALERLRATFRWKADGLDAAGLRTRVGASSPAAGAATTASTGCGSGRR